MSDLLLNQWQPLNDLLAQLRPRMAVNDNAQFIHDRWECKYIDVRIDMRIGTAYARPGSGPDSIYTKLAQAEHERDVAVQETIRLTAVLQALKWPGVPTISALDATVTTGESK